jgi:hypothetical protein
MEDGSIANCRICGGVIHRRWSLSNRNRQPWLHLHQSDWIDKPHNAEPYGEVP